MEQNCLICGMIYKVSPSHKNRRKYCSKKCDAIGRTKFIIDGKQTCSKCKMVFPIDKFNRDKNTSSGYSHYCVKCKVNSNRKSRNKNIDKYRIYARNYMRIHRIGQNGKDFRNVIGKRDYPNDNLCEICEEKVRLVYHHWDNSDFSKGMWICTKCHVASHWLEKYNPKLFYDLKHKINLLSNNAIS